MSTMETEPGGPYETAEGLNWVQTFFNPFGDTPRVQFTRAWTILFFVRLTYLLAIPLAGLILMIGGVEDATVAPPWGFHVLVLVTVILSFVAHLRRLANAQRNPLWAMIVLLPLIAGGAGFAAGLSQGGQEYRTKADAYFEREARRGQPATEEEQPVTAVEPDAEEETEEGEGNQGRRGGGDGEDPFNPRETSQRDYALEQGLGLAMAAWAPLSFFVMIWTLMWVGRLPSGGGTIRSRFETP
ncbi:MAG: hypothetical protein AAFQ85_10960 [Pseudomonadota bacterium]